jgi:hypothetical protein
VQVPGRAWRFSFQDDRERGDDLVFCALPGDTGQAPVKDALADHRGADFFFAASGFAVPDDEAAVADGEVEAGRGVAVGADGTACRVLAGAGPDLGPAFEPVEDVFPEALPGLQVARHVIPPRPVN